MFSVLKSLFEDKCPICSDRLHADSNAACSTKTCPKGHYKEESYGSLGVRIVYDRLK
ncbi:hypothetical protein D3C76_763240 [compost metagenome]